MTNMTSIKTVAVVGAGGNLGTHITRALVDNGRHNVVAISRQDSPTTSIPQGIDIRRVDYDAHATLVTALHGVDALVITLSGAAPPEQQLKLIDAAADAGVPYVLPNEWSPDTGHAALMAGLPAFASKQKALDRITQRGRSAYIAVVTGFWYEWMLAMPEAFGFDFTARSLMLFDDGRTRTCVSTWPQIGRAVAALLSLPVAPDGEDAPDGTCLNDFCNSRVYIRSFTISQSEMFDSVLRVTGNPQTDWKIGIVGCRERFAEGMEEAKGGNFMGLAKAAGARVFYTDDAGNFEKTKGTANELLNLPEEDLDEATKRAFERATKTK